VHIGFEARIRHRANSADARVVDKNVDLAEALDSTRNEGIDGCRGRNVRRKREDFCADGLDFAARISRAPRLA
jgi:hypothetical protein